MNELTARTVTQYLRRLETGDPSALRELLPLVYADLRAIARRTFRNTPQHTLQPTALVHEAYLRLVKPHAPEWSDRKHFLRVAALAMRQLLADRARSRNAEKRGGGRTSCTSRARRSRTSRARRTSTASTWGGSTPR